MNDATRTDTPRTAMLPAGPLNEIERQVRCVELQTPDEQVLELREKLLSMKGRIAELLSQIDDALIERQVNVTVGPRRIYVAKEKDTKCISVKAAMEALLNEAQGDWDTVADCLSSNAIKHGAAREVLGEKWGQFFEVVEKDRLKVMDVNTDFLPKKRSKK